MHVEDVEHACARQLTFSRRGKKKKAEKFGINCHDCEPLALSG